MKLYEKKILILLVSDNYFYDQIKSRNIDVFITLRRHFKFLRMIRRMWMKLKFPFASIWFDGWKKNIKDYDTIIIFDSVLNLSAVKWICKKNRSARKIYWYWNPIKKTNVPYANALRDCEKWSFDMEDCRKYNLNLNTQFYFEDLIKNDKKIKYDVMFVGTEKNRTKILCQIKQVLQSKGLNVWFYVVGKKSKNMKLHKNFIAYDKVLEMIRRSRCILDVMQENQTGLTLRVMEALFFQKKLITNNLSIKNYDFYNKNNIFIIGIDQLENLKMFIDTPFERISKDIVKRYDFENWLERFLV